jgi:hypothetical protein
VEAFSDMAVRAQQAEAALAAKEAKP